MSISENLNQLLNNLNKKVTLVAVSKTKPIAMIEEAYNCGQRIFGENKVQELVKKHSELPKDIEWHMIGHLQTNKVKFIAPFVNCIHSVDSIKLLKEIDKRAIQNSRSINCLIQVHIAKEDGKFGIKPTDLDTFFKEISEFKNINIIGLMGMATFSNDKNQIRNEFKLIKSLFEKFKKDNSSEFNTLSIGMSGDYNIAIEEGSTMIRVGSGIFGSRK
ncbi:MAG: YggS family pyridoxal phosphate-dependent enzyme [Flavobacteriales bacterium]